MNQEFQLQANVPHIVEFYIRYNPNEGVPKLSSFSFNSKTLCPGGPTTQTLIGIIPLYTSKAPEVGSGNGDNGVVGIGNGDDGVVGGGNGDDGVVGGGNGDDGG